MVSWTEAGKEITGIKALGGRHRQYALLKVQEKIRKELDGLERRIVWTGSKKAKETPASSKLQADYKRKKGEWEASGHWLIAFYDRGKSISGAALIYSLCQ
jgi:hypothetical protein